MPAQPNRQSQSARSAARYCQASVRFGSVAALSAVGPWTEKQKARFRGPSGERITVLTQNVTMTVAVQLVVPALQTW